MAELVWYVVRSATRREKHAERGLREQGFEVYLPCLTRWRRHAGKKDRVQGPLFPGYLFVAIDHSRQSCLQVNDTDGVYGMVSITSCNGEPVPVPEHLVVALREAEAIGKFDKTLSTDARFTGFRGQRVHITGGQFIGYLATLLQDVGASDKKARVSLEGLGGGKMPVNVHHLKAA